MPSDSLQADQNSPEAVFESTALVLRGHTHQLAADLWPRSGSGAKTGGAKTSSPQTEPVEEEECKQSLHNMFSKERVQPSYNNINPVLSSQNPAAVEPWG